MQGYSKDKWIEQRLDEFAYFFTVLGEVAGWIHYIQWVQFNQCDLKKTKS